MTNKALYNQLNLMAMGTRFNMLVHNIAPNNAALFFNEVKNELTRLDEKYSRFNFNSTLSIINSRAINNSIIIDNETALIIENCIKYKHLTDGAFDITLAELTNFWHKNELTEANILIAQNLLGNTGVNKISFNNTSKNLQFQKPNVMLDFGAYLKGYALEQIRKFAQQFNILNLFVSFGESSIITLGKHPYGEYWPVGIMQANNSQQSIYTFNLSGQALSTSGYTTQQACKKQHIINSFTGLPFQQPITITVMANSATEAEVLSTSLLITPSNLRDKIINNFNPIQVVEVNYTYNPPLVKKLV